MPFIDEFFADSAPGPPYWDVPVFPAHIPILRRPVTELTSHFCTRILPFFSITPLLWIFFLRLHLSPPLSVFFPMLHLLGNHSLFILFKLLTSASLCPHHYLPQSLLSYFIDLLDKLTIGISFKCSEYSLSPVMSCILMSLNIHQALNS